MTVNREHLSLTARRELLANLLRRHMRKWQRRALSAERDLRVSEQFRAAEGAAHDLAIELGGLLKARADANAAAFSERAKIYLDAQYEWDRQRTENRKRIKALEDTKLTLETRVRDFVAGTKGLL